MTTPGDVRSFAHTGTNSGPSIRGTGSSNPFPSANSADSTLFCDAVADHCRRHAFFSRKGGSLSSQRNRGGA